MITIRDEYMVSYRVKDRTEGMSNWHIFDKFTDLDKALLDADTFHKDLFDIKITYTLVKELVL